MHKVFRISLLSVIILTILLDCNKDEFKPVDTGFNYELIITSGLDENNLPVNELSEINLDTYSGEKVYFFVKWKNLENITYRYTGSIYNPNNYEVYTGDVVFNVSNGKYNTWTYITFNETNNMKGIWTFEAYMNDDLGAKINFRVK